MMAAVAGDLVRGHGAPWWRAALALPFDVWVLIFIVPAIWICPAPGLIERALIRGRETAAKVFRQRQNVG
jgi:hypothetical protein